MGSAAWMPALLTSTSSLPIFAMSPEIAARSVRSKTTGSSPVTAASNWRSRPNTFIPDFTSASAAARPMPRPAPVTSAVFTPLTLRRAQSGHVEAGGLELGDEAFFLLHRQLDERRPAGLPIAIVAEMRHRRLERRDHRLLLHNLARGADAGLQPVCVRGAPVAVEVGDRARIDVAGGGDAALASVAHVVEQEHFAAGEDVEAILGERVEHRLGVGPVSRGILHPGDNARIFRKQPFDERQGDRNLGDRRDVIEIKLKALVAHALDHLGKIAIKPL